MEEKNATTIRKRRPRIGDRHNPEPTTSSGFIRPTHTKDAPEQTRRMVTSPRFRHDITSARLSRTELLEKALNNPQTLTHQQKWNILSKIINEKEKRYLDCGQYDELLKKYNNVIRRQYVCAAANDDIKNYLSAQPQALLRDDDVRLETMELLHKKVEEGELSKEKFDHVHKLFFSDIISKDNQPNAQTTKMLRCVATGKFYAPIDANKSLKEQALSPAYRAFKKRRQTSKNYSPQDYDFFGENEKHEPLCPIFHAVNDSGNIHKIAPIIASRMAQMGIPPEEAYQFNTADIAHIMQKDGELKDIEFQTISADVGNSPYQEFANKFGLLLKIGGASRLSNQKKTDIWLKNFATPEEVKDSQEWGTISGLNIFTSKAESLYNKLAEDFTNNGMSPDFIDAWADSLCENKSLNPNYVQGINSKPFKIEIHHWERLSAAMESENPADKNNLENFGLMIMYQKNGFDIHKMQHAGESAHYLLASLNEKQQQNPRKYLVCTSGCFLYSSDLMNGREDHNPQLQKIKELHERIKKEIPQKPSKNKQTPTRVIRERA